MSPCCSCIKLAGCLECGTWRLTWPLPASEDRSLHLSGIGSGMSLSRSEDPLLDESGGKRTSAGAPDTPSSHLAKAPGLRVAATLAIALGRREWGIHRNSNRASKGVPCPLEPSRSLILRPDDVCRQAYLSQLRTFGYHLLARTFHLAWQIRRSPVIAKQRGRQRSLARRSVSLPSQGKGVGATAVRLASQRPPELPRPSR